MSGVGCPDLYLWKKQYKLIDLSAMILCRFYHIGAESSSCSRDCQSSCLLKVWSPMKSDQVAQSCVQSGFKNPKGQRTQPLWVANLATCLSLWGNNFLIAFVPIVSLTCQEWLYRACLCLSRKPNALGRCSQVLKFYVLQNEPVVVLQPLLPGQTLIHECSMCSLLKLLQFANTFLILR